MNWLNVFLAVSVLLNVALVYLVRNPPCRHKWEVIKRTRVSYVDFGDPMYSHSVFTLQCEHCGNVKKKKVG